MAAYRLMRRCFSANEMTAASDWARTMRERERGLWTDLAWHLLVAERGGKVVGAASGTYLGNVNVGVVGYLAVKAGSQGTGLGPRLRRRLVRLFERDARRVLGAAAGAIVGEVREDNPWLRSLVRRQGAIALDFPYYQPALDGKRALVPLVLYFEPCGQARRSLGAAELRRLLYTMFRRAYRIARPLSRPAFQRMMRSLAHRRRIGQRRLPDQASRRAGPSRRS